MNKHLVAQFKQLGADETSALLATQVYLELCEVKRYWSPTYEFSSLLRKIVIRVKKKPTEECIVFVPICSFESLSFTKMQQFLNGTTSNCIFLAIVHPDSTCVYYKISVDLDEPVDTTAKHLKVNNQQKLDAHLRKHNATVEHAALYDIPFTSFHKENRELTQEGHSSRV